VYLASPRGRGHGFLREEHPPCSGHKLLWLSQRETDAAARRIVRRQQRRTPARRKVRDACGGSRKAGRKSVDQSHPRFEQRSENAAGQASEKSEFERPRGALGAFYQEECLSKLILFGETSLWKSWTGAGRELAGSLKLAFRARLISFGEQEQTQLTMPVCTVPIQADQLPNRRFGVRPLT
jgi:hypothetical protein